MIFGEWKWLGDSFTPVFIFDKIVHHLEKKRIKRLRQGCEFCKSPEYIRNLYATFFIEIFQLYDLFCQKHLFQ